MQGRDKLFIDGDVPVRPHLLPPAPVIASELVQEYERCATTGYLVVNSGPSGLRIRHDSFPFHQAGNGFYTVTVET